VPGNTGHVLREREAAFALQHAQNGKADGHNRRLCILSKQEIRFRSFPHQPGQILRKRFVDFSENLSGRSKSFSDRFPHADGL
jgi:hypothetical protein